MSIKKSVGSMKDNELVVITIFSFFTIIMILFTYKIVEYVIVYRFSLAVWLWILLLIGWLCVPLGFYYRIKLSNVIPLIICIIIVVILTFGCMFYPRDFKRKEYSANARDLFTIYPIMINSEIEDDLNIEYCLSILNSTIEIYTELFNYSFIEPSFNTFQCDNTTYYDDDLVYDFLYEKEYWTMRKDTFDTGIIDLTIRFNSGESGSFSGKSNHGPRIVILVNGSSDYWDDSHALLHEMGHSFGLDHTDSSDMLMNAMVSTSYVPIYPDHNQSFNETHVDTFIVQKLSKYNNWTQLFITRNIFWNNVSEQLTEFTESNYHVFYNSTTRNWTMILSIKRTSININTTLETVAKYDCFFIMRSMTLNMYYDIWEPYEIDHLNGL